MTPSMFPNVIESPQGLIKARKTNGEIVNTLFIY